MESREPCSCAARAITTPDPDQQVHGKQQQAPEGHEEHEIRSTQHPVDRGLEEQHQDHIEPDPLMDLPRMEDRAPEHCGDHHEEREGDAVRGEVVMRLEQEVREPGVVLLIGRREPATLAEFDLAQDGEERRHEKAHPGATERDGAHPSALLVIMLGQEHSDEREEQRRPDDRRQDDVHATCTQR